MRPNIPSSVGKSLHSSKGPLKEIKILPISKQIINQMAGRVKRFKLKVKSTPYSDTPS